MKRRLRRIAVAGIVVALVVAGVLLWAAWRLQRQDSLDRALCAAVRAQDATAVRLLLAEGADANARGTVGPPPTFWQHLLSLLHWPPWRPGKRADTDRMPVLCLTARTRDVETARLLLNHGAHVNAMDATPLLIASRQPYYGYTSLLLDRGARPNVVDRQGMTPLSVAAQSGAAAFVRLLLDKGADPNLSGPGADSALIGAATLGDCAIPYELVAAGADVNAIGGDGQTALWRAASDPRGGSLSRLLLQHGARTRVADREGRTPLHGAAACGGLEAVRLLLAAGADPNARSAYGYTPLMEATNAPVMKALLGAGARADARDSDGHNALWQIAHGGKLAICEVRLLLEHGADPNGVDKHGHTLLLDLARDSSGLYECIPPLLEHGANPNVRDELGMTPLLWMCRYREWKIVCALVAAGADVRVRTRRGVSALGLAGAPSSDKEHRQAIRALKQAGARE